MSQEHEQFLGSKPGLVVEVLDSTSSPYSLKTTDGFEFVVSAEDFNNFYRQVGGKTSSRWINLVSDPSNGLIDTEIVAPLIDLICHYNKAFNDYPKARSFLRWFMTRLTGSDEHFINKARKRLERDSGFPDIISDDELADLTKVGQKQKELLASEFFAEMSWPVGKPSETTDDAVDSEKQIKPKKPPKESAQRTTSVVAPRMKNVELRVDDTVLTIVIDLSKDFGPSKSGRTNIVATTEGNKTVPGRDERIGMTVYRELDPKLLKKGAKDSFKNVKMQIDKEMLSISIDLSVEVGPSKSGKNMILATTGGNQLVFTRPEKIGLNVYRQI